MANSQGDPRVLLVLNLLLSTAFAALVVWALSFVGMLAFEWRSVAALAAVLAVATHVVTR